MCVIIYPYLSHHKECDVAIPLEEGSSIFSKKHERFIKEPIIHMIDDSICTPIWIDSFSPFSLGAVERNPFAVEAQTYVPNATDVPVSGYLAHPRHA